MKFFSQLSISISIVLFTIACGGGGGSSEDTSSGVRHTISLSENEIVFTLPYKASPPPSQQVTATFSGAGVVVGTVDGSDLPNWLELYTASTSGNQAQFDLVVPISISAGETFKTSTTLRFITGDVDGSNTVHTDLRVVLDFVDAIYVEESSFSVSGLSGAGPISAGTFLIDTIEKDWQISTESEWISFSETSGSSYRDIEVFLSPENLIAGQYDGTFSVSSGADSFEFQASIAVSPKRIASQDMGFAFLSIPDSTINAKQFTITDSSGLPEEGLTTSNKPEWINVDIGAGGLVTLSTNDSGMEDGLYCGDVTLASSRSSALELTINGCYYKASTLQRNSGLHTSYSTGDTEEARIVSTFDTVRPYLYVHNATTKIVSVYNIYSNELLFELPAFENSISAMVVSDNGVNLYARYADGFEVIDLETRTKSIIENQDLSHVNPAEVKFGRIKGLPFLYDSGASFLSLTNLEVSNLWGSSKNLSLSKDGKTVISTANFDVPKLHTIELDEGNMSLSITNPINLVESSFGYSGIKNAINADGSEVYVLEGIDTNSSNQVSVYDGEGQFVRSFDILYYGTDIKLVGSNLVISMSSLFGSNVIVYNSNGQAILQYNYREDLQTDVLYYSALKISAYEDRFTMMMQDGVYKDPAELHIQDL